MGIDLFETSHKFIRESESRIEDAHNPLAGLSNVLFIIGRTCHKGHECLLMYQSYAGSRSFSLICSIRKIGNI